MNIMTEAGVERVLNDLAKMGFEYIVCDSPAGIEHGAVMALTFADEAVIVTNPEVSSVRDSDRILGITVEKRFDRTDTDDEDVPALLIVHLRQPPTCFNPHVADRVVIRSDAVGEGPTIIFVFVDHIIVEAGTPRPDIDGDRGDVIDVRGLGEDGVRVVERERPAVAFVAVRRAEACREVKEVNIVRAVFLEHLDDVLAHAGQDRRDDDRRQYADHDAQDRQERAELVPDDAVIRHAEDLKR